MLGRRADGADRSGRLADDDVPVACLTFFSKPGGILRPGAEAPFREEAHMGKIKKFAVGVGAVAVLATAAAPAFATVANVGGGTWNYGRTTSGSTKNVWSNYVHNSKRHSSTAILGAKNVKKFANARSWSNASVSGPSGDTAFTYWATY